MKSKYLVVPNHKNLKSSNDYCLLFPLKGFCVGFLNEFSLEEIPDESYIYVNRLLDTESILKLKEILQTKSLKGIVFEDLGILQIILDNQLTLETIFYPTHAITSTNTLNAYLDYVNSAVISLDITKEETEKMLNLAKGEVSYYLYGPLPYMYSRRSLLTNYEKNFSLKESKEKILEDEITHKKFRTVENEYGTVLFDEKPYDGRIFLNHPKIKHFIINTDANEEPVSDKWLQDFLEGKELEKRTDGFLNQKTIYILPPKKEGL